MRHSACAPTPSRVTPLPCPPRSSAQRRGRASLDMAQIGTKPLCPGKVSPSSTPQLPPVLPRSPRAAPVRWHRPARGCHSRSAVTESGDGAWHLPRQPRPRSPVPTPRGIPRALGTHLPSHAGPWHRWGELWWLSWSGKVPALETRGSDVQELQPCPAHP